tara:strand:+ start:401 stop:1468 length:1068 start_codon:yes stop_codon:yes gene_type:complete
LCDRLTNGNTNPSGGSHPFYSGGQSGGNTFFDWVAVQVKDTQTFNDNVGIYITNRNQAWGEENNWRPTDINVWIGEDPSSYTFTQDTFQNYFGRITNCTVWHNGATLYHTYGGWALPNTYTGDPDPNVKITCASQLIEADKYIIIAASFPQIGGGLPGGGNTGMSFFEIQLGNSIHHTGISNLTLDMIGAQSGTNYGMDPSAMLYGSGYLTADRCVADITDNVIPYDLWWGYSCMTWHVDTATYPNGAPYVWAKIPNSLYLKSVDVMLRTDGTWGGANGFPFLYHLSYGPPVTETPPDPTERQIAVYVCNQEPTGVGGDFSTTYCYNCSSKWFPSGAHGGDYYTEQVFTCDYKCI